MNAEALLESLIQRIYEAAAGTASWASFLVCLAGALDSGFPTFFFADPTKQEGSLAISVGMDEKSFHEYGRYYHPLNVWTRGAAQRDLVHPGMVRLSHELCSRRDLLRSEWYADFCRPHNWSQGMAATILRDGAQSSNVAVFADGARRPYDDDDAALFRALLPHLQRGLRMHMHLAASHARGQALEAALNGLNIPVLLVSAETKILFMNAAAEELLRVSDGLVAEGGVLRALLLEETRALQTLVAGAAQTSARHGRMSGGRLRVSRRLSREPLEIDISPLPSRRDEWLLKQSPAAALFVIDRSRLQIADDSALIRLHGLTASEARVARAISRGLSGKVICRDLNISYNTLKTHLKHIYAKTQTRHQIDLLRVLAGGARIARNDGDPGPI